jgi:hypothetical protein
MSNNILNIGQSNFVKSLQKFAIACLGIGAVGSAAGVAMTLDDPSRLLGSYLLGFVYFMGIGITALFFTTLQFLANAGWATLVRRLAEFFAGFVPFIIIGLAPILLDVFVGHKLYHWTHPEVYEIGNPQYDAVLVGKQAYLNPIFFAARVILYYVIWFAMYKVIVGNSLKQDDTKDLGPTQSNWGKSAVFILLYALTLTFAGFDLVMSLDPHWFSTMFGVYFFAGNFVATLSMIAIFAVLLKNAGYLQDVSAEHFHDLGKLMFAFNVFWTYIAFSQYFLYWYGNLTEETLWYLHRLQHGWEIFAIALLLMHFIVPFALLLPQSTKRNPKTLMFAGFIFLVMHLIDLSWIILPHFNKGEDGVSSFYFGVPEISFFVLFLGVFLFLVAKQFQKHQYIAKNDPYIKESIELVS